MLEAGEKAAREQLESLQRKAAAGTERVAALNVEAGPLLARGRVTRAEVEPAGELPPPGDDDPITRMNRAIEDAEAALRRVARLLSPRWSGPRGIVACAVVAGLVGAAVSFPFIDPGTAVIATAVTAVILGFALWLFSRWLGRHATMSHGRVLARSLAEAARACRLLSDHAAWEYAEERVRISERHSRKKKETNEHYLPLFELQRKQYEAELVRIETEYAAATEKIGRQRAAEAKAEEETYTALRAKTERRLDAELASVEEDYSKKMSAAAADRDDAWARMAAKWMDVTAKVAQTFSELRNEGAELFPPWNQVRPAARVPAGVRFGEYRVDLQALPDGLPADSRLAPPPELSGPVPAFLPFPDRCSVLLRARDEGRAAAVPALQAMMLRFLTGLPPGKVRFTIIDPVGLGENFAAFMHLADSRREARHVADLDRAAAHRAAAHRPDRPHRERDPEVPAQPVQDDRGVQPGRRAKWPSRTACWSSPTSRPTSRPRRPSGSSASRRAARRAASARSSAPTRKPTMPRDFNLADLEAVQLHAGLEGRGVRLPKDPRRSTAFPLDARPPARSRARSPQIVQRVGKASKDAARVEVPFEYIAPEAGRRLEGRRAQGLRGAGRPGRGDAAAVVQPRPRHRSARARRRQDRLRQIDAAARAHHEPRAALTARTKSSCTSSTSRRASSSRGTRRTACRTPASSPSRASASSA